MLRTNIKKTKFLITLTNQALWFILVSSL